MTRELSIRLVDKLVSIRVSATVGALEVVFCLASKFPTTLVCLGPEVGSCVNVCWNLITLRN